MWIIPKGLSDKMLPVWLFLMAFGLLYYTPVVMAYSRGAPIHACRDGRPIHGAMPQTSPSPYSVVVEKINSDPYNVKVKVTLSGTKEFRGFFIQSRDSIRELVGRFTDLPEGTSSVRCSSDYPEASITHTDANVKEEVILMWEAPEGYSKPVTFSSSFVLTQMEFWVDNNVTLDISPPTTVEPKANIPTTVAAEPEAGGGTSSAETNKNAAILLLSSVLFSLILSHIMRP